MSPANEDEKKEKQGAGAVLPGAAPVLMKSVSTGSGLFGMAGGGFKAFLLGKIGIAAAALGVGMVGMAGYQAVTQKKTPAAKQVLAAAQVARPGFDVRESKRDAQGSNSLALMEQAGQGEINWAGAGGAGQDGAAADAPAGEGEG
ncbi:MAG: hypothetical protein ABIJ96_00240, partial [Elusimicrobiota bacterium]